MSTIVLFKVSFSPALCKSCARQIQRSLNQTSGEPTPEGDLKREGVQQNCYGRTVGNWESHGPVEELFKLTTSHRGIKIQEENGKDFFFKLPSQDDDLLDLSMPKEGEKTEKASPG